MTGSLQDIVSRLRMVLPKRWFAEESPNLLAILRAIATPWAWLYGMITYVIAQSRVGSATDRWLDLIAYDFFGSQLHRKPSESDPNFRNRIKAALMREAATRSAVSSGLEALTGRRPFIFEPANCLDTGSYGGASRAGDAGTGMAYGMAGGWGNLGLPLQFFITVSRPPPSIGMVAGYGTPNGGYGEGMTSYVNLASLPGTVTDQDILSTLSSLLPLNAVAWLRIS